MGQGPRDYSDKTLKRLFALSGNECAFPGCSKRMVNEKNAKESNICHIEAANKGGQRYNTYMTDENRADYENLILLCVQHHEETNDIDIYTVEKLKEMKRNHESNFLNQRLKANPSMLNNTISAFSKVNIDKYPETQVLNIMDPGEKIRFNELKKNSSIIHEYKVFQGKLNTLYEELEKEGSIRKQRLLERVKFVYEKIKGDFILDSKDPIKIIKANSDKIFDQVYDELYKKMEDSQFFEEDIVLGLRLILVDAFIRCKILEEPTQNAN
ncbi:ABC-three component system protein [Leptospira kanakyensis]|uniref:ABC-three component systems C-terminal domain-containing protein n=1 Tax=Leptospira kanakyensis TaxID=2484968 RepID=A0A6N4QAX6_9LEPT|nr:ABC-three component system protein [Leptospira kanakyensis]MCW7480269.1 hypothetical protein [Leptospira kanakyensis]TGK50463.1 hypothetical protein EHQ11_12320 [Leptospira kanakyensis]TGK63936.1 hypothetical protein EHQ16_05700 [Leptospira kanakyensis]TGK69601.1 hypothetical protein EHQ18_12480 [Leptospira kanakyensis]